MKFRHKHVTSRAMELASDFVIYYNGQRQRKKNNFGN